MSEENGYTSIEEIERDHSAIRYKDISIEGKKFQLRSFASGELTSLGIELGKRPATMNERIIVKVCGKPKFTIDAVKRLANVDGAFVARLARECLDHIGIEAIEISEVEAAEKN